MPKPLAICLEDLDARNPGARFLRCVAAVGRTPGLRLDGGGRALWRTDAGAACELWVSLDDRLILYRTSAEGRVTVRRAGRSLEAPVGKPVVLLHEDRVDVGARRLRIHVHGATDGVREPAYLPAPAPSRAARTAAAAVALGAALGGAACGKGTAATPTEGGPGTPPPPEPRDASSGPAEAAAAAEDSPDGPDGGSEARVLVLDVAGEEIEIRLQPPDPLPPPGWNGPRNDGTPEREDAGSAPDVEPPGDAAPSEATSAEDAGAEDAKRREARRDVPPRPPIEVRDLPPYAEK